jgi:SAM-dependent methyltransferase
MTVEKDVFTRIYNTGAWSNGSGSGSHPDNTRDYRHFIQRFMKEHSISSVLDLGCGDWQSSCLLDWSGISYLGLDIVEGVIARNVSRYQTESVRFGTLDSPRDALPAADLLIVKDVLQHWPNDDIRALFPRLAGYRFALITNTREPGARPSRQPSRALNRDIGPGGHRPVDLALPPFGWPVREVFRHTSRRASATAAEVKATVLLTGAGPADSETPC